MSLKGKKVKNTMTEIQRQSSTPEGTVVYELGGDDMRELDSLDKFRNKLADIGHIAFAGIKQLGGSGIKDEGNRKAEIAYHEELDPKVIALVEGPNLTVEKIPPGSGILYPRLQQAA